MAGSAFKMPDTKEEYVELELVNVLETSARGDDNIDEGSSILPNVPPLRGAASPNAPSGVREVAPVVEAAIGSMSVMSAETSESGNGAEASSASDGGGTAASGAGTSKEQAAAPGSGSSSAVKRGGIIAPGILSQVAPHYPEEARQAGVQGTVLLTIQILVNGSAGQIVVYRSSGSEILDDAAIAAVKKWRFMPAKDRESGQAIVCYTKLPVVFKLRS